MSVKQNLNALMQEVPQDRTVRVVVVTKYATLEQMQDAFEWGIRDFGENKIQDYERKTAQLPPEFVSAVRWHFLGHLQSNKINKTLGNRFDLIHSIDSLELAQKLSNRNEQHRTQQPVLLQVNLTREPQKSGFPEEVLRDTFSHLIQLQGISIQGLMTIGPYTTDAQASKHCFCHLRDLRDQLVHQFGKPLPELSMGMSQDFAHAIECGATIIRIGNRIFGAQGP